MLLRKDQTRPLMVRKVRARVNGRSSHLEPIAFYVIVHIRQGTALRGRPLMP